MLRKSTIFILIIFIIALGIVIYDRKSSDGLFKGTATPTSSPKFLTEWAPDDVVQIEIRSKDLEIKLDKDDSVVSLEVLDTEAIMTITEKGYGKRTAVRDYRKTARAGKGVINLKVTKKTGDVVNTVAVNPKDSIIITTAKGMVIRTSLKNIRVMGRATQGVRVVKLQAGDKVTDIVKVVENGD